jgi:hypothetical protein
VSAQVWTPPALTAATPLPSLVTPTGVVLLSVVPSPSCPRAL